MKLSLRISLLVVTLVLLSGLLMLYFYDRLINDALEASEEQWVEALDDSLSETLLMSVIDRKPLQITDMLNRLVKKQPSLEYIYVIGFDGQFFADTFRSGLPRAFGQLDHDTHTSDSGSTTFMDVKRGEIHDFAVPLLEGMKGHLHIGINDTVINGIRNQSRQQLILITAGISLLALLIILPAGRRITHPLEHLVSLINHHAHGDKVDFSNFPKTDPEINTLVKAMRDMMAERNFAMEELAHREQYLSLTLNSIGDAVIATDAGGNITRMNPVAETLTGWPIPQATGQALPEVFNIINANSREAVANPVEKVLHTGKIIGLANHTVLLSKDGNEYQIADSAAPIKDAQGDILGVILVFHDVTREYQREEALRRSQKMEAIGRLSGGIAHDFNNQLGVVIGYLDFLKAYIDGDEKPRKWVETATHAAVRCMDLTRQLLTFSRTQARDKTVVELNSRLRELDTMISRSVTPEVEVRYILADELWLTDIDPGEFQDVILNLVINARDAMPNGGKLLIETCNIILDADYATRNPGVEPGNYVQLMLSDTGTGMTRETLEHIFEPFFTTKSEDKGTGLGLAMVYGFVKRYGGHVKVYSEMGVGTTLRLYLPRSSASSSTSLPDELSVSEAPTGDEYILIVDDETDLLHLADHYLSEQGYHTCTATNAAEALSILEAGNPVDLLFSDVVMPGGMNGYELAQRATESRPGLKILLTSGFTSKTVAHNGLARFSACLLVKPYRRNELAQRIRHVLDREVKE